MNMKTFVNYSWMIVVLPLFMACSSSKMALNTEDTDNVYVSNARAKEGQPYVRTVIERNQRELEHEREVETTYSDEFNYRDPYIDDISFTSRITRFRNYSPWRNYFDPWYDFGYDPFFYNNSLYQDRFLFRTMPSWSFNLNFGPSYFWNDPFYNPWLFRSPFVRYNYWDMYSFYRPFPYPNFYGGFYGNTWGMPIFPGNPRMNRPRPSRGSENMNPTDSGRIRHSGSRAERYGDGSPSSRTTAGSGSNGGARPSHTQQNSPAPRQNSGVESRPTRTERYNPPSSSSSRGSDSSGESRARPSRAGGN